MPITPRKRQPLELLARIAHHLAHEWQFNAAPMPFRDATKAAYADVAGLIEKATPPKRYYYGSFRK